MNNLQKTVLNGLSSLQVNDSDLAKINKLTLKELTTEQVFTFKLAICDNEVDRDYEIFTDSTLEDFAKIFIGKTIIADHNPKSSNQAARIYDAEVETTTKLNSFGMPYKRIVAKCYMPLTPSNADLITEIEAGIKKEVSVGASIERCICSICGSLAYGCNHIRGKTYDGNQCYYKLDGAKDGYEVSFVAVPSQRGAGVTKQLRDSNANFEIEKMKMLIKANM